MRGRGKLLANLSHDLKPRLKGTNIDCMFGWKAYCIFMERRVVPFLSEGTWLFADESFKGVRCWRYWSWLAHRSVDLVVFLVLISCHPVSQPSKRRRDTFVGESFGGRQGDLVGLCSLIFYFLLINRLGWEWPEPKDERRSTSAHPAAWLCSSWWMWCVLLTSLLGSRRLLSESFSYHSMAVVNLCFVGYLDILS